MLPAGNRTILTRPPIRSMSQASSVASASTSSGTASARSSAARRNTCGVCTAHSRARGSVRTTSPAPSASLIVSATGVAAIAASWSPSAAIASRTSSAVMSGRAASWTTTGSPSGAAASALRTDCERCSPPSAPIVPGGGSSPGGSATTTWSTTDASAFTDHSSIGFPPSMTNALGRSAPRRSPRPAATRTAIDTYLAATGTLPLASADSREQVVQMGLGAVLVHLERVHQLGREDLLRPREHLLLTRREPLLGLPQGKVPHDLGELIDVARLDLVAVVLEAPVPVLRHLGDVVGQHVQHLLDRDLVDDLAQPRLRGVLGRAPSRSCRCAGS